MSPAAGPRRWKGGRGWLGFGSVSAAPRGLGVPAPRRRWPGWRPEEGGTRTERAAMAQGPGCPCGLRPPGASGTSARDPVCHRAAPPCRTAHPEHHGARVFAASGLPSRAGRPLLCRHPPRDRVSSWSQRLAQRGDGQGSEKLARRLRRPQGGHGVGTHRGGEAGSHVCPGGRVVGPGTIGHPHSVRSGCRTLGVTGPAATPTH